MKKCDCWSQMMSTAPNCDGPMYKIKSTVVCETHLFDFIAGTLMRELGDEAYSPEVVRALADKIKMKRRLWCVSGTFVAQGFNHDTEITYETRQEAMEAAVALTKYKDLYRLEVTEIQVE